MLYFEEKAGTFNASEHHPNYEAKVWQHLWGHFAEEGTGVPHKIVGIMQKKIIMWMYGRNI